MSSSQLFPACRAYIEAQLRRTRMPAGSELPFITISREAGAGAGTIARLVAEQLNERKREADHEPPWTLFDKNLVERVLEDHELPERIKEFMPENTTFDLTDAVEELLGLHPSNWTLVQHTTDTILRLARLGNVILVGRGANIITANVSGALHVRLVAPLEVRIEHMARFYHIAQEQAARLVRKTDRARRAYVKHHFNKRIDDPLQYHLTINTGRLGFEAAALFIADAVRSNADLSL